jgi:pyrroloquinoline quinone (PQQ) biosynthesis protein C
MAICKSYEYMYLFLERCMDLERPQEAAAPSRERRFAVRA